MEIIKKRLEIPGQSMISGIYEASVRIYKKFIGKSGKIWLIADELGAGANIYVEGGKNSQGFGGREISFELTNGEIIKLKGPWHSNCDALFKDTGHDARNQHFTYVVISLGREGWSPQVLSDILYDDGKPKLGAFDRGTILAQEIANKIGKTVICYSQSNGGSSCGPVKPEENK